MQKEFAVTATYMGLFAVRDNIERATSVARETSPKSTTGQPRQGQCEGDANYMHPVTEAAEPPFPACDLTVFRECYAYALETQRELGAAALEGRLRRQLDICESPIERRFLAAIYGLQNGYMFSRCRGIVPQQQIGPYRVDFLIQIEDKAPIVVECDGHDFHERTKEQARRDKARDRYLQVAGYKVLRFTGSEIWADPLDCAQQALCAAYDGKSRS